MDTTISEVLQFVKENEVKFIRLSFCDVFGVHKNISVMAGQLESAFRDGVNIDAHAVQGFEGVTSSDLLLFPDPATLTILPWRPGPGRILRFYCDIKTTDGAAFSQDTRGLLKQVLKRVEQKGYLCKVGAECEFYLFKTDERGNPTDITLDTGGYLDVSPLDKGEDIRREICLTLEQMGIQPETSHHKQGPGQNEIDFKFGDALTCADNFQNFKAVVKAVASRNGLFASFMPKPIADKPGSGLHVSLSLTQNGLNVFKNAKDGHSKIAESFIAGILEKTPEMTLFLNPLANSYERFGTFEAPKYVSWSHNNRSQLVRIPAASSEKVRMELRSPDPSVNPYLAFALIIAAGLSGIEKELKLPPAVDADLHAAPAAVTKKLTRLPDSLTKAVRLAKSSDFVKSVLGEDFLARYIALKTAEASAFSAAENAEDKEGFYRKRFFSVM